MKLLPLRGEALIIYSAMSRVHQTQHSPLPLIYLFINFSSRLGEQNWVKTPGPIHARTDWCVVQIFLQLLYVDI